MDSVHAFHQISGGRIGWIIYARNSGNGSITMTNITGNSNHQPRCKLNTYVADFRAQQVSSFLPKVIERVGRGIFGYKFLEV